MPSKFRWNLFEAISYKISPVHLVQDVFAPYFVVAMFAKNEKNIICGGLIFYLQKIGLILQVLISLKWKISILICSEKKFRIIYFELVFFTIYVNIFCIVEKKFNYKVLNQMDRAIMGHEFRVLITLLMPKSFRHLMQRIHQFRGKGRVGQLSLAPELRLNSQLYDRPDGRIFKLRGPWGPPLTLNYAGFFHW